MVRPRRQLAVAKFVQVRAQHILGEAAEGSHRLWGTVRNFLHGAPELLQFLIALETTLLLVQRPTPAAGTPCVRRPDAGTSR